MKRIIKLTESQLINFVNNVIKEINIEKSYINNQDTEQYQTKNKNVFGNSPNSNFIDYGIQFMPSGKGMYQVMFFKTMPDEFYSFVDQFDDDVKNEILNLNVFGNFTRNGVPNPYQMNIGGQNENLSWLL
jgi:hypothetical protein